MCGELQVVQANGRPGIVTVQSVHRRVEMMQRARFGVALPVHQPHENPLPPEGFLYCVARGLRPGFIIPLRVGSLNLTAFYS
jgi:hypothetical protein